VYTATTSLRREAAISEGTANSGVPAKTILMGGRDWSLVIGDSQKRGAASCHVAGMPARLKKPANPPLRITNHQSRIPALLQLLVLLQRPVALERRQMVDEELAVEVVDLVLDAGRQQVVDLEHEGLAVAVQ